MRDKKEYWTVGELTLDSADSYILEAFSYQDHNCRAPSVEHFREAFESRQQALDYIESLHSGQIVRHLRLTDMTKLPPVALF